MSKWPGGFYWRFLGYFLFISMVFSFVWLPEVMGPVGVKLALPSAIISAAVVFVGSIAGQAATAGAISITSAAISAGSTLVLGAISYYMRQDKLEDQHAAAERRAKQQTQTTRLADKSRKYIYGEVRKGGNIVFIENAEPAYHSGGQRVTTGPKRVKLGFVSYICDGPVEEIKEVWAGENEIPLDGNNNGTGQYDGQAFFNFHKGASDQQADPDIVKTYKRWTSSHRGRGVAYAWNIVLNSRTAKNRNIWSSGFPNLSYLVQGKNDIEDPRNGTTGWTDNPALIARDYMLMPASEGGLGLSIDEIDDGSVKTAANVCDQTVNGESRYTANGVIDTQMKPQQILTELANTMAGRIYFSEGKWHIDAGEWTSPVKAFDEDDILEGFSVSTQLPRNKLFNTVKGRYLSPANNWQPANYPQVQEDTFLADDNNEVIDQQVDLMWTTSETEAQRIARVRLREVRQQETTELVMGLRALELQVGDNIELTVDKLNWSKKTFVVRDWSLVARQDDEGVPRPAVKLSVQATDSTVFDTVNETTVGLRSPALAF